MLETHFIQYLKTFFHRVYLHRSICCLLDRRLSDRCFVTNRTLRVILRPPIDIEFWIKKLWKFSLRPTGGISEALGRNLFFSVLPEIHSSGSQRVHIVV